MGVFRHRRLRTQLAQLLIEPGVHVVQDGNRLRSARARRASGESRRGIVLDRIQPIEKRQGPGAASAAARLPHVEGISACSAARGFDDPSVGLQEDPIVAVKRIRLQHALIVFQEFLRTIPFVIRSVVVHRIAMPVVSHVGPEPTRPRVVLRSGSSTFTGVSSVPSTFPESTRRIINHCSGNRHSAACAIHPASVLRRMSTP